MVFTKEHIALIADPSIFNAAGRGEEPSEVPMQLDNLGQTRSKLNCTIFSDEYLALWRPLFVLRHPAKTFPSLLRVERAFKYDAPGLYEMFSLLRDLYDLYCSFLKSDGPNEHTHSSATNGHSGIPDVTWPIVMDADDYMEHPEMVKRIATAMGLDASKLQFSWDAVSKEDQGKNRRSYPYGYDIV